MVGVSRAAWVNYEAERTSPTLETLLKLHVLKGVDLGWLITGETTLASVDAGVLVDVIRGVEESKIELDPHSRAKLIAALYNDRKKSLEQDKNETQALKAKGGRS